MSTEFWRDTTLPYVESRRACDSRICYQEHSHPTYSIGAVDGGGSVFTGAPGGPVPLAPGSLVFVPAYRSHACNPLPDQSWSYQMLHLDAAWLEQLWQESAKTQTPLQEPIRVCHDALLYAAYCELNTLLFSSASSLNKEAALIEFLLQYGLSQGRTLSLPLQALAQEAGLSRYQLIRAFRRRPILLTAWVLLTKATFSAFSSITPALPPVSTATKSREPLARLPRTFIQYGPPRYRHTAVLP